MMCIHWIFSLYNSQCFWVWQYYNQNIFQTIQQRSLFILIKLSCGHLSFGSLLSIVFSILIFYLGVLFSIRNLIQWTNSLGLSHGQPDYVPNWHIFITRLGVWFDMLNLVVNKKMELSCIGVGVTKKHIWVSTVVFLDTVQILTVTAAKRFSIGIVITLAGASWHILCKIPFPTTIKEETNPIG